MFALGCIQAQHCHTGQCPTGVTTQDPLRQQSLVVLDKAERVYHFHQQTLHALQELVQAAGCWPATPARHHRPPHRAPQQRPQGQLAGAADTDSAARRCAA
jgi:glutamate synthase domain-containing protein 2